MTQLIRSQAVTRTSNPVARSIDRDGSRNVTATQDRQRRPGNFASQRGEWPSLLQTKLTIGEPGEFWEQEADRVADKQG